MRRRDGVYVVRCEAFNVYVVGACVAGERLREFINDAVVTLYGDGAEVYFAPHPEPEIAVKTYQFHERSIFRVRENTYPIHPRESKRTRPGGRGDPFEDPDNPDVHWRYVIMQRLAGHFGRTFDRIHPLQPGEGGDDESESGSDGESDDDSDGSREHVEALREYVAKAVRVLPEGTKKGRWTARVRRDLALDRCWEYVRREIEAKGVSYRLWHPGQIQTFLDSEIEAIGGAKKRRTHAGKFYWVYENIEILPVE